MEGMQAAQLLVLALAGTAVLGALVAAALAPSAAEGRLLAQHAQARQIADFWQGFQAEVTQAVRTAAPPPQVPAGPISPNSAVPPLYLYHGTARRNMGSIFARGIEGRSAGWAYMARDVETARSYGRSRGGGDYVVFRVLAQQAYQQGVHFEQRGGYFVARSIHPVFVDFHWALADLAYRQNQAAL